jgi:mRNA-degrading endonuclease RelE of RelBE toxin-antitoxin system
MVKTFAARSAGDPKGPVGAVSPQRATVDIARRIGRGVDRCARTGQGDVRKLESVSGLYRLRVGDYRVIFEFEDGQLVIVVLRLGNRRDVYRD